MHINMNHPTELVLAQLQFVLKLKQDFQQLFPFILSPKP